MSPFTFLNFGSFTERQIEQIKFGIKIPVVPFIMKFLCLLPLLLSITEGTLVKGGSEKKSRRFSQSRYLQTGPRSVNATFAPILTQSPSTTTPGSGMGSSPPTSMPTSTTSSSVGAIGTMTPSASPSVSLVPSKSSQPTLIPTTSPRPTVTSAPTATRGSGGGGTVPGIGTPAPAPVAYPCNSAKKGEKKGAKVGGGGKKGSKKGKSAPSLCDYSSNGLLVNNGSISGATRSDNTTMRSAELQNAAASSINVPTLTLISIALIGAFAI